jgi:FkbM family methyltransferase
MRIGTQYGGWWIPPDTVLGPNSLVVSAGVGEDISFDIGLQSKFGCDILLIDPTPRAEQHLQRMRAGDYTGLSSEYISYIKSLHYDINKLHLEPVGLWSHTDTLKFYKQENPAYVSQSLLESMYTNEYTIVPVERLKSILERKGLLGREIDLLKMDIEGAELCVLETMLEDKIYPRILCVEFDYFIKGKDKEGETKECIVRLMREGYRIVHNDSWNITFLRS